MKEIKDVDLELLSPSLEFPSEQLQKVKLATPEVRHIKYDLTTVFGILQHYFF